MNHFSIIAAVHYYTVNVTLMFSGVMLSVTTVTEHYTHTAWNFYKPAWNVREFYCGSFVGALLAQWMHPVFAPARRNQWHRASHRVSVG